MNTLSPYDDVSVVVVCYNEEANIGECLDSLVGQDYSSGTYEIVVVDNGSTDATADIVKEFQNRYPFIRIIVEPRRGMAIVRNAGVRASRFPLIAYLDADCVATPHWLRSLVTVYQNGKKNDVNVVAVGGQSLIPEESGSFQEALKIALNCYIGSAGRVTGKCHPHERYVKDLPSLNIIYERSLFDAIGYYNESILEAGEDADFSYRIIKRGMKLLYSPAPVVYHKYRTSPSSWWRNMQRYGRARARLIIDDPSMINFQYLAPLLLVTSLFITPLSLRWPVCALPLIYFPLMFLTSFHQTLRKGKPRLLFFTFVSLCSTHLGYGLGEIEGFLKGIMKQPR